MGKQKVYKESLETRIKKSLAKKGKPTWNKGKKTGIKTFLGRRHTEESKLKMRGKNHPRYKGGVKLYPYSFDDLLREKIRERDLYTCQMPGCGVHQSELSGFLKKLDVHHIDYDKNNVNQENLITLCHSCHAKTNYNQEYWIKVFSEIISGLR